MAIYICLEQTPGLKEQNVCTGREELIVTIYADSPFHSSLSTIHVALHVQNISTPKTSSYLI